MLFTVEFFLLKHKICILNAYLVKYIYPVVECN